MKLYRVVVEIMQNLVVFKLDFFKNISDNEIGRGS